MGTPGDKAELGKVVQSQLDPDQQSVPSTTAESSGVPQYPQPSTSTATSDMGVISRLPQFETFATLNIQPSLSQTSSKPESFQASLGGLGQAHIEDYFSQRKSFSTLSESLQILYPTLPPKPPKTFLSLDQPGPSGLQTPKTKSTAATVPKLGVKKTKKPTTQHQKKTYTCPVCQKNFVSAEKLSKHQQIHTGTSPFKCEHCKKLFSSKFKLVRHVLIHSDRKPFSCTVCERTFHRKDHLKNHIKVHSPSKKIYVCEKQDCKKEYTSMMSYRKHQALHAAEEGSLQCQICSSVFKTKDEILYHLKVHAGSRTVKNPSEKKFTCDQCDRKFFTKKDVRRHLVVHTGMRDFLCQFCPQRFGRKDHLVRHIKKSHSKNVPPEDLETAIKSETTTLETIKLPETIVKPEMVIKSESEVKAEFSESSLSNPEQFGFSLEDILPRESFEEFNPYLDPGTSFLQVLSSQEGSIPSFDLPSTSSQEQELESTFLKDIGESPDPSLLISETLPEPGEEILGENVLSDPALQRLLQPTEEKNLPLPGFRQTFQSPPPPP